MKYVHKPNLNWCIPPWTGISVMDIANTLEEQLAGIRSRLPERYPKDVNRESLRFWIEIIVKTNQVVIWEDAEETHFGTLRIFCADDTVIELPLNPLLHGHDDISQLHSLYVHGLYGRDLPSFYVGITARKWFERLAEHIGAARRGSPYLFHRAIRERRFVLHRIVFNGVPPQSAMQAEEEIVSVASLYPLGLNMIPGGLAGLRYLSKLGIRVRSPEERDSAIQQLILRPTLEGKPNPLCAARWESDPDYAERVICGHSGRLTGEQVRQIRLLTNFGKSAAEIAEIAGARKRQILNVISGRRYSRIRR